MKASQVTEGQHLMLDNRTSIDGPAAHHPRSSAQQQPVADRADRADRSIRTGGQIAGGQMESTGGFLSCFGDAIDDRVADMLTELLDERAATLPPGRQRLALAALGLLLAMVVTVVLRHQPIAVCTVWPSTAVVYLAATRRTRTREP
jgi:hypothetical protein